MQAKYNCNADGCTGAVGLPAPATIRAAERTTQFFDRLPQVRYTGRWPPRVRRSGDPIANQTSLNGVAMAETWTTRRSFPFDGVLYMIWISAIDEGHRVKWKCTRCAAEDTFLFEGSTSADALTEGQHAVKQHHTRAHKRAE